MGAVVTHDAHGLTATMHDEIHGIDADEAFSRLVQQSQHTNVKLHEVARMLVDSVRHRRF